MKTVLFACVHNAGRSQMAAAWFNLLSDPTKARAISAGTEPGPRVHPEVVTAMCEVGVDLSGGADIKIDAGAGAASADADHDGMRRSVSSRAWCAARRLAARGSQGPGLSHSASGTCTRSSVSLRRTIIASGTTKGWLTS